MKKEKLFLVLTRRDIGELLDKMGESRNAIVIENEKITKDQVSITSVVE